MFSTWNMIRTAVMPLRIIFVCSPYRRGRARFFGFENTLFPSNTAVVARGSNLYFEVDGLGLADTWKYFILAETFPNVLRYDSHVCQLLWYTVPHPLVHSLIIRYCILAVQQHLHTYIHTFNRPRHADLSYRNSTFGVNMTANLKEAACRVIG